MVTNDSAFIGVDPDLQRTCVAVVNGAGRPVLLKVCEIPKGFKEREAVPVMAQKLQDWMRSNVVAHIASPDAHFCVEGQEIAYTAKSGANPRDLLLLASISGACLASYTPHWDSNGKSQTYFPRPAEWKGQTPKRMHHTRTCIALGWGYIHKGSKTDPNKGYAVPVSGGTAQERFMIEDLTKGYGFGIWQDMMDAIGLALWAREEALKRDRIARAVG